MADHIIIAGAGIVGVSTAIWLQRSGHNVTIVDKVGPAGGTSYGNAGILAGGAIVPVTTPGLWKKVPGMLFDKNAPLFLRWGYLPKLIPFLNKYMRHCTNEHVEYYAQAMALLQLDTVEQHQALAKGTGAEHFIGEEDYCFGYKTRAEFEKDKYAWDVREKFGVKFDIVSNQEYMSYDPYFDDRFEVIVRCKNHGRISDPGAYVKQLAHHFVEQGGTITIAEISGIQSEGDHVTALETNKGLLKADKIILTLGAWSAPMAQKLGLNFPMESEGGYHIELINPSSYPKSPMMVASGKFVITPMQGRIRLAGIVEFGGIDGPTSRPPLEMLKRQVKEILPNITYDRMEEWHGHRPALPNSLPAIGKTPAFSNAYIAAGHQHLGLTGGAKTGRLIANIINETPINMDLTPFSPEIYS